MLLKWINYSTNEERKRNMEKVYGHRRASTQTQKTKGFGLDEQENTVMAYCIRHGYDVIDFIREDAISGNLQIWENLEEKRPLLIQKIKEMKEKGITKLVTKSVDRLWRSDDAHVFIRRLLYENGIELISIMEPEYQLVEKNPERKFKNNIDGVLATYERDKVVKRLNDGRDTKFRKGHKSSGKTPFGYKFSPETKKVVIDKYEAKILQSIFEWKYQDQCSLNQIIDRLKENKWTNRDRKYFSREGIRRMLINPFYFGLLHQNEEYVKGQHDILPFIYDIFKIEDHQKRMKISCNQDVLIDVRYRVYISA